MNFEVLEQIKEIKEIKEIKQIKELKECLNKKFEFLTFITKKCIQIEKGLCKAIYEKLEWKI